MKLIIPSLILLITVHALSMANEKTLSSEEVHKILSLLPPFDHSSDVKGQEKEGIREDIEIWISKFEYKKEQMAAIRQLARSYQGSLLVNTSDEKELKSKADNLTKSINCLNENFSIKQSQNLMKMIRKYTINAS